MKPIRRYGKPKEARHNPWRFVIGRTRAACGVDFFANILDICKKTTLHPSIRSYTIS